MSPITPSPIAPGPFIDFLWTSQVVTFGDFVTKSGRRSPYFIDAGLFRSGAQFATLGSFYADVINETFGDEVDVLFGPAYKGIPLAIATSIALSTHHGRDVGVCFDRKEAKDHGEGGAIIGHRPQDGDRIVIVEDVTTAGTSIRLTVPMLQAAANVEIVGLVVGVDRQERGTRPDMSALAELTTSLNLKTVALTNIDDIIAHVGDALSADDHARIGSYRAEFGVE